MCGEARIRGGKGTRWHWRAVAKDRLFYFALLVRQLAALDRICHALLLHEALAPQVDVGSGDERWHAALLLSADHVQLMMERTTRPTHKHSQDDGYSLYYYSIYS